MFGVGALARECLEWIESRLSGEMLFGTNDLPGAVAPSLQDRFIAAII